MTPEIDGFIGIYRNALSDEFCESAIAYYETMEAGGFCRTRRQSEGDSVFKTDKDDSALFCIDETVINVHSPNIATVINTTLWNDCYSHYCDTFDILKTSANHFSYTVKIQKTKVGGGYHIWHYEASNRPSSNRILAWTAYLNDVAEGGETEFLYQSKRIKAEKGMIAIWPASFTHVHRGNPPLSNTKYIATGTIEF